MGEAWSGVQGSTVHCRKDTGTWTCASTVTGPCRGGGEGGRPVWMCLELRLPTGP